MEKDNWDFLISLKKHEKMKNVLFLSHKSDFFFGENKFPYLAEHPENTCGI